MATLISMGDFLRAKKLTDHMATIATAFVDEYGRTLDELGRKTVFFGGEGKPFIRPGDPEHEAIWKRHEAALVQETAHLIRAMKGARFSVWCAALRIAGIKQGIKIPLRPSDWDPDEPGQI